MQARTAYLAFQAEIGADEVVLPYPWRQKKTPARKASNPIRVEPTASASPDFFKDIAQVLTEPAGRQASVQKSSGVDPALPTTPDFESLPAYWTYVNQTYPRWFPAVSGIPLAVSQGSRNAALAVVESAPDPADTPQVFAGPSGDLLDKMMKAIGLERDALYLTSLMKTPDPGRPWPRKDMARMLPLLFRELRLAACPMVLLLGETCVQTVLRNGSGFEAMRHRLFEAEGLVFAVSHHPRELLRNENLKRSAWEDLKWLRGRLAAEKS